MGHAARPEGGDLIGRERVPRRRLGIERPQSVGQYGCALAHPVGGDRGVERFERLGLFRFRRCGAAVSGTEVGPPVDLTDVLGQPGQVPTGARRHGRVERLTLQYGGEPPCISEQVLDVRLGGDLGAWLGVHEA